MPRSRVGRFRSYWTRAGVNRVCPLDWSEASTDPTKSLVADAEACDHPSGSTRMGTDPVESVLAPDLHCHSIPNLSVVSASAFPTAGSGNPTLTIMQLALRLAD